MTVITHAIITGGVTVSSALVVPDGSPTYPELMAERDRLLEQNAKLVDALGRAENLQRTDQLWEVIETIACGAKIDCVKCGKPKPCDCDHEPSR